MKKAIHILIDLIVFGLAAAGSLMAFGFGASLAVLKSAFTRKNPLHLAQPSASKARSALFFIYQHCGLPQFVKAASDKLSKIKRW